MDPQPSLSAEEWLKFPPTRPDDTPVIRDGRRATVEEVWDLIDEFYGPGTANRTRSEPKAEFDERPSGPSASS